MMDFSYARPADLAAAGAALAAGGMALGGGTGLLDLAKLGVARPVAVVDLTRLPGLDAIQVSETEARIGALVKMSRLAAHPAMRAALPAVGQALLASASPQIRNMATIGGNLLQRTRCAYFRDAAVGSCNRRNPGSGCAAVGGVTRGHALLGVSPHCIATHPGDLAVALVAFDAVVETWSPNGQRLLSVHDFFLLPGATPGQEFALAPGEIVTGLRIPLAPVARQARYVKLRDRASYEFAAASLAAGMSLGVDGRIADLRLALGGVATIPWRARSVEAALIGEHPTPAAIAAAAALAMREAEPQPDNRHKLALVPALIERTLTDMVGEPA
ncbi:FAD-binding molybdopterin dehydrogenase [Pseudoroseomonas deserti]|uniref:FAD-binding molybdopterin dehydrogenase n=1 Tax=Teichococcus deserti TaxID=1817963 RepID=A0A1V2GV43_9PROT|nr:FAD binding domain-containing protein [Pseudoroseomonas deserti]ONG46372.1 FAD-binding molybdopterin dehydrogenase [Pseudoroseomonas deserti]